MPLKATARITLKVKRIIIKKWQLLKNLKDKVKTTGEKNP